jgi:hypothetical protein
MTIPDHLIYLIEQLNQELDIIQQESQQGLNITRSQLDRFPDNLILVQIFGILNNHLLFVEICRRRISYDTVLLQSAPEEQIQSVGEDLATLLGQVIESKIIVNTLKTRLEKWP